ncbi:MAG: 50S ribosomal protein L21 [Dehalogenimonas sp.]|uniref:Large ribosomal subunit protein bL21 n=1 Tax=Candidatus Dehalogenimonas loeffleri TaxID=3127115 RepID=A0ABZ2JAZ6_9CHLR|nr:50S ribosomal protein L21 [Dehalogenimonas sp.]
MYAIVESGGKQYKVTEGQVFDVDRLDVEAGGTVEFERVLLFSDGEAITTGKPTVEGAKVVAKAEGNGMGEKVRGLRYKNKTRAHTRTGGRALFTRLKVESIVAPAK